MEFGYIVIGVLIAVGAYFIHKHATSGQKPKGGGGNSDSGDQEGFKK